MILFLFVMTALRPATDIKAFDTSNDGGKSITIIWTLSPDDSLVKGYEIWRADAGNQFKRVGSIGKGIKCYADNNVQNRSSYTYRILALSESASAFSNPSFQCNPRPNGLIWKD